jgi:hypothetical protein
MTPENIKTQAQDTADAERAIDRMTHPKTLPPPVMDALGGMAAGAITGVMAGPPGVIAGMVLGSAIGATAGLVAHREERRHRAEDDQLDRDIGVVGGTIGEAKPDQPPPVIGAFSVASMGASGGGGETSDGPIQNLDD